MFAPSVSLFFHPADFFYSSPGKLLSLFFRQTGYQCSGRRARSIGDHVLTNVDRYSVISIARGQWYRRSNVGSVSIPASVPDRLTCFFRSNPSPPSLSFALFLSLSISLSPQQTGPDLSLSLSLPLSLLLPFRHLARACVWVRGSAVELVNVLTVRCSRRQLVLSQCVLHAGTVKYSS